MIEVFKTNVTDRLQAQWLLDQIHTAFTQYRANFDLEDCDRILRVTSVSEPVQASGLIAMLKEYGYQAEILPDGYPPQEGIVWVSPLLKSPVELFI